MGQHVNGYRVVPLVCRLGRGVAMTQRDVLEDIAAQMERAVRYHTEPRTGMQVPWHSAWANKLPPSILGELRRTAKMIREVLAEPDTPPRTDRIATESGEVNWQSEAALYKERWEQTCERVRAEKARADALQRERDEWKKAAAGNAKMFHEEKARADEARAALATMTKAWDEAVSACDAEKDLADAETNRCQKMESDNIVLRKRVATAERDRDAWKARALKRAEALATARQALSPGPALCAVDAALVWWDDAAPASPTLPPPHPTDCATPEMEAERAAVFDAAVKMTRTPASPATATKCGRCGDAGYYESANGPEQCECGDSLDSHKLPLSGAKLTPAQMANAARVISVEETIEESPDFQPKDVADLAAKNYQRSNRWNAGNVWVASARFPGTCSRCGQREEKHFSAERYCFEPSNDNSSNQTKGDSRE